MVRIAMTDGGGSIAATLRQESKPGIAYERSTIWKPEQRSMSQGSAAPAEAAEGPTVGGLLRWTLAFL